jgi:hypothetical protein
MAKKLSKKINHNQHDHHDLARDSIIDKKKLRENEQRVE